MKETLLTRVLLLILVFLFAVCLFLLILFVKKNSEHQLSLKKQDFVFEYGKEVSMDPKFYLEDTFDRKDIEVKASLTMHDNTNYPKVGTYAAKIVNGKTSLPFKIEIKDTIAPSFSIFPENIVLEQNANDVDILSFFEVTDLSLSHLEVVDSNLNIHDVGSYSLEIKAIDEYGNHVNKRAKIDVVSLEIALLSGTTPNKFGTIYTSTAFQERKQPKEVNNQDKIIALTFDDGPNPNTLSLMSCLDQYQVPATFFVLGSRVERHPDILSTMHSKGYDIGTHSFSHGNYTKMTVDQALSDFNQTQTIVKSITGETPIYFRPPYGSINDQLKAVLPATIVLWNVDSEDWRSRNKDSIKNHVLAHLKNQSLILFHDIYSESAAAVCELIPDLQAKGYQFVRLKDYYQ